jgi:hypothetical protein
MINTYKKGNRNQQKAKKFYEGEGYAVEVVRRDKWRKDQDFFGLWDLICVKHQDIRFVQVKTNANPSREWKERANKWGCPKCAVREWVVYRDYQKGVVPSSRVILGPNY